MKALLVQADKTVKVEEIPKFVPGPDEILVKVATIGQNPTDWKHASYFSPPGAIIGCDFAGTVAEIGSNVKSLKVGDRVSGMVLGGDNQETGAFAEYVHTDAEMVYRVPDNITFEQAATVPVPAFTAVQVLYRRLGLPEPGSAESGTPILIWSGATSVGQYAIQLAKLSGLKVFTTASKQNHELLKSLGADFIFDYHDADVVDQIKKASGDSIEVALDCVSEDQTLAQTADSLSTAKGGRIDVILAPDWSKIRKEIKVIPSVLYTAFGKALVKFGHPLPAIPEDRVHHVKFQSIISNLLAEGKLKTLPIKLMPGGLDGVQAGFDYMKAGKVRAEKLVYTL
eukprot:TRINITY_DN5891_c0_g1_i1.p1 TRINITY_DN5891_c0_g1~~TRINITY_DN5891_c0_g1_i1.p1  ORF type:complete len:340 (-),score=140.96 TRINITY_DN5891_c0_g1_i1:132-1151(-)